MDRRKTKRASHTKRYEGIKDLTEENYARQWEIVIEDALSKMYI